MFLVVKPPQLGGAVYDVAPQHMQALVRHVHRSMLKPVPITSGHSVPVVRQNLTITTPNSIEHGIWVVVEPKETQPGRVQAPHKVDPVVYPAAQAAASLESSIGASAGPVFCVEVVRKSTCGTAGTHSNPHHLPVSVRSRANEATASQILGSSNSTTVIFRPWF